jgi:kinesin family protein 3/17
MLREFQEEIARLKAQLEFHSDGKTGGVPGAPGVGGKSQIVEVEKVVHVEDKDKLRELEEKLEKEKIEIKIAAEKEREEIEQKKNIAEEERKRLLEDLKDREEEQNKAKAKQQKLLKRLKGMEEKLLQGNQVMEQAMQQELELQKAKADIEDKRRA